MDSIWVGLGVGITTLTIILVVWIYGMRMVL